MDSKHSNQLPVVRSTASERRAARQAMGKLPPDSPAKLTRTLAYVLDDLVPIPGTNIRLGIDPILSLIPAAGTSIGALMGTVVLIDAVRLRAPVSVVTRMLGNYLLDWGLGMIPFIGSLFDLAYRSNRRNIRLLNRAIHDRDQVHKASKTYWLSLSILLAVVVLIVIAVPVGIIIWLFHYLGQF